MIEFKNLSVNFKQKKGSLAAVHDVSFQIKTGEIFGIAGSSGAGKSTLLRTVNLLQSITSGHILVDGVDISGYRGKKLREHRRDIGMIFQHFNLADNLTVYQNIAFILKTAGKGRKETDETVRKYLSLVDLLDKKDVYPGRLSGGQKQRVAIARALAGGAKILLCDEPTSALDTQTTVSILNLIQTLNQTLGITVVIITHELDVIKSVCHRCAVMDGGEVAEIGGVYDLFTKPKKEFTRRLIGHATESDLPSQVLEHAKESVIKLTFRGNRANTPVISEVTARFGIRFNILVGRIEYIEGRPLGILYGTLTGDEEAAALALIYLKETVKEVEVIKNGRI